MRALIIFYSFAPQNNCASIPNTKLVKYLEHEDINITLITNALLPDMEVDESLLPDNVKKLRRFEVHRSKLYLSTVAAMRRNATNSGVKLKMKAEKRPFRAKIVSVIKSTYFRLSGLDWKIAARQVVKKELHGEHFDVVYSSYPALGTHVLAEYVIQEGIADKWIADFRDPMYYTEYDKHRYQKKMRVQHKIEKKADHIVVVSEGAKEKFLFDDVPESKITYLPNGYDPDDFDAENISLRQESQVLRFFYAGQLYAGKRNLSALFRAVSELVNENAVDPNHVRFEYAGNEWPVFEQFADQYSMKDCCVNYGFVTRQKVMDIMSEIDCSVVATHNTATDQGVVTGKVFELLLVGKPIVTLVGGDLPNSELGRIVKECSAGVVYEEANAEADYYHLKQWLKEVYAQKQTEGKIASSLNKEARDRYNYQNIAKQLYGIMKNLNGKQ